MAESIELLRLRAKAKFKFRQEQQASTDTDLAVVETYRPIIKKMESGGRYDILHPKTKSGKQALGAYGVVPEFWFDEFPELGLNSKDDTSKKDYLSNPALQDEMFTKIALKGMKEGYADPKEFRAWYYGGKVAVNNLRNGTGNKVQTAYDNTGNKIDMPSHAADSQMFDNLLNGVDGNVDADKIETLDTRAMAGLGPLPYPKKGADDPANTLFNNPEAQAASVQRGQQKAVSDLPMREQMGAGLGAFAYKMPGMGQLAELSGLAPKGSAANKKEEVAFYNQNRTMGQMGGELLPDVLMSTLGGVGAAQAMKLGKIGQAGFKGAKATQYAAEGAAAGGISAGIHQAQHVGSGVGLKPKEAVAEVIASALLGTLGGKLGDKLVEAAPKILRRSLRPTLHESTAANPPDYAAALDNELIPKSGNLEEAARRSEAKMASLETERAAAARAASQEPIPPSGVPAPTVPKVAPAPIAPKVAPAPIVPAPIVPAPVAKATPGYFPIPPEQQVARRTAMVEADKARRIAEATARKTAEVKLPSTPVTEAPTLSSLAGKQAALKPAPKADKAYTTRDTHPVTGYHGTEMPFEGPLGLGGTKKVPSIFFHDTPDGAGFYSLTDNLDKYPSARIYKSKLPKPDFVLDFNKLPSKYADMVKKAGDAAFAQHEIVDDVMANNPRIKLFQFKNAPEASKNGSMYVATKEDIIRPYYENTLTKAEVKADKGYTKADKALIDDATKAETALALQKKLRGQRGAIYIPGKNGGKDYSIERVSGPSAYRNLIDKDASFHSFPSRPEESGRDPRSMITLAIRAQKSENFQKNSHTLVAKTKEGKILGAINYAYDAEKDVVDISSLGSVDPKNRVGEKLLKMVNKIAARMGKPVSGAPSERAIPLYEKMGATFDGDMLHTGKPKLSDFASAKGENPTMKPFADNVNRLTARRKDIIDYLDRVIDPKRKPELISMLEATDKKIAKLNSQRGSIDLSWLSGKAPKGLIKHKVDGETVYMNPEMKAKAKASDAAIKKAKNLENQRGAIYIPGKTKADDITLANISDTHSAAKALKSIDQSKYRAADNRDPGRKFIDQALNGQVGVELRADGKSLPTKVVAATNNAGKVVGAISYNLSKTSAGKAQVSIATLGSTGTHSSAGKNLLGYVGKVAARAKATLIGHPLASAKKFYENAGMVKNGEGQYTLDMFAKKMGQDPTLKPNTVSRKELKDARKAAKTAAQRPFDSAISEDLNSSSNNALRRAPAAREANAPFDHNSEIAEELSDAAEALSSAEMARLHPNLDIDSDEGIQEAIRLTDSHYDRLIAAHTRSATRPSNNSIRRQSAHQEVDPYSDIGRGFREQAEELGEVYRDYLDPDTQGDLVQGLIDNEYLRLVEEHVRNTAPDPLRGQRGAILNPFHKAKPKTLAQLPMRESKKIEFIDKPLKLARETLDKEIGDPTKNKFSSEVYEQAKDAFDYWEKEAIKRPTVKGDVATAKMTVEDGLSFRQAIDKEIKFRKTQGTITDGFNKASLSIRDRLNDHIAEVAPDVGRLTKEEGKILPFKKSLDNRVEKNLNAHIPSATIKLGGLIGGGLVGAADSKSGNRKASMITGALGGLTLAQLATTPGGAAILFKTGKSLQNPNLKRSILNQLVRSSAVKSREKK